MKCAVITPFGPGHEQLVQECKVSLKRAMAHSMGPFSDVVHIVVDDSAGRIGRSSARNKAVSDAAACGADWLFMIDADDLAMENVFDTVSAYVDDYDALWGQICTGDFSGSYEVRAPQVQSIGSVLEVMALEPTQTLQMGHFVRTSLALQHPFDTERDFGEDFDYYLHLWSRYRCVKISQPLFLNRIGQSASGPRSGDGFQWRPQVHKVISQHARRLNLEGYAEYQQVHARFMLQRPYDLIHSSYIFGRYYREPELDFLCHHLEAGLDIVDIGSCAGNDLVFMAQHLQPATIVAFEPNLAAVELLEMNLSLNGLDNIDCSRLGCALGMQAGRARLITPDLRNLGYTVMQRQADGDIPVRRLDDVLDSKVDFIRLDVPEMALRIMSGAQSIIVRYKPRIMVEIGDDQLAELTQWLGVHDYEVQQEFTGPYPRQPGSRGMFLVPRPA